VVPEPAAAAPLTLHDAARHLGWDRDLPPVKEVGPGDTLHLELRDAGDGQITPDASAADVAAFDPARANPLTGPIRVAGAEPGDAVVVTVLGVETADWGWTALIPGFGLLADQFPDPYLRISRVSAERVDLGDGLVLPARPFPGTLGLAPSASGRHPAIPPRVVGGNLDVADLVAGTRLWLPVAVPGALLSAGDGHAAQGRGEVCGTAVETPARLALRVDLRRGVGLVRPRMERPAGGSRGGDGPRQASLGVHTDLRGAARDAVSDLVDWLGREHGMAPELAYCLCSVAADLAIEELVNEPAWVVSASLPLSVL